MSDNRVIIAGGGIAGLALGLTLHQIGVPFTVYESAREMKPLGVGINLQPNAVRELFDLGITAEDLDKVGLPAEEWALVGLNGREVYSEPRGLGAGYNWPQYAVHRGQLHMLLYDTLVDRAGADAVQVCSVLYQKGVEYISEMNASIESWMESKGFNSVDQFRGRLNYKNIGDPAKYERAQFMRYFSSYE